MTQQLEALKNLADSFGYELTPKAQREQEKFEVGKWIVSKVSGFARVKEVKPYSVIIEDYDNQTKVVSTQVIHSAFFGNWQPATAEQVFEHLKKLAELKGYTEGVTVIPIDDESYYRKPTKISKRSLTSERCLSFGVQGEHRDVVIYLDGQWAEIVETKPKSVWELIGTSKAIKEDYQKRINEGTFWSDMAFSILLQAVEKWNEQRGEKMTNDYTYPAWSGEGNTYRTSLLKVSPFNFASIKSAQAFFALEDAQELLKLVLNVK